MKSYACQEKPESLNEIAKQLSAKKKELLERYKNVHIDPESVDSMLAYAITSFVNVF